MNEVTELKERILSKTKAGRSSEWVSRIISVSQSAGLPLEKIDSSGSPELAAFRVAELLYGNDLLKEEFVKVLDEYEKIGASAPSEAARYLKKLYEKFAEMPVEFFDAFTFGNLEEGTLFVIMPHPGDNHFHGGIKAKTYVFRKVRPTESDGLDEFAKGFEHGVGVNLYYGQRATFPLWMPVIPLMF